MSVETVRISRGSWHARACFEHDGIDRIVIVRGTSRADALFNLSKELIDYITELDLDI